MGKPVTLAPAPAPVPVPVPVPDPAPKGTGREDTDTPEVFREMWPEEVRETWPEIKELNCSGLVEKGTKEDVVRRCGDRWYVWLMH